MARRLSAVLLLLAASLASAQTTTGNTITVRETSDSDRIINIDECLSRGDGSNDKLFLSWNYSAYANFGGTYRLTISDTSSCPSTGHNQVYDNIPATAATGSYPNTGDAPINVSTLLASLSINCSGSATLIYLCVDYLPSSGANVIPAITDSIKLDLATPPPPIVATPTAGDGALNISWSAGSGSSDSGAAGTSTSYDVVVTNHADATDQRTVSRISATTTRVGGLTNGVTYDVVVYAYSPGSNKSAASNQVSGAPVPVDDFWRLYRNAGGRDTGGCGTGTAGAVALIALVPLALRRRRRS